MHNFVISRILLPAELPETKRIGVDTEQFI